MWYDAGMRRRVVNVLAVVSAVVCVLSLAVVGRSFFWLDSVVVPTGQNNSCGVQTMDGQLVLMHVRYRLDLHYSSTRTAEERPVYDEMWQRLTGIRWLGMGWERSRPFSGRKTLILPLWVVPIVTAIPPVWWWRVRRRAGGRGFALELKGSSPATEETVDTE
jgi:hypothetical protein